MKLDIKPKNCPFCDGLTFAGTDPLTLETFIECRNPLCLVRPGIRNIMYGDLKEVIERLVETVWNRRFHEA